MERRVKYLLLGIVLAITSTALPRQSQRRCADSGRTRLTVSLTRCLFAKPKHQGLRKFLRWWRLPPVHASDKELGRCRTAISISDRVSFGRTLQDTSFIPSRIPWPRDAWSRQGEQDEFIGQGFSG